MRFVSAALIVGAGGFAGAVARFAVAELAALTMGESAARGPAATGVINVTGSFALGVVAALVGRGAMGDGWRLALGVGFLGAYTTFSTWMADTHTLANRDGGMAWAAVNVAGSVVLGVLAFALGTRAGGSL